MSTCTKKWAAFNSENFACISALLRSATRLLGANSVAETAVPLTVDENTGTVIITGGGANASNVTLPDPDLWTKRMIRVSNFSGAAQTILSAGTGNRFKAASGAATANVAAANNSFSTWVAKSGLWYRVAA